MIAFVDHDSSLMSPLAGAYDFSLVLASYAIAALAAYAGLMICDRIAAARHSRERWSWIVAGSVVMGFGVWTMHFIGMIAFTLPIPVGYDVSVTAASLLPAAVASGCALHVIGVHGHGRLRYIVAGALIGAGIGAMHYTGMAAMRMDAVIRYDPALFVLSIVVAVALGITALYASDFKPRILGAAAERARRPLAAALIGLAITGMHYTAMEAT
jgi:NO-binding membrane sensor protein with MHYT domain